MPSGGADQRNARYEEARQELRLSDKLDAKRRRNQWEGPHSCDCSRIELKTFGFPDSDINLLDSRTLLSRE